MHPLQQRVDEVRRWWNRRALLETLSWTVAGVIAACLIAGVADYAIRATDRGLRMLLTIGLIAAMVYGVWRLVRWWSRERYDELSAAQALQRAFPQLGDRLASAIEFLRQDEDDPTAGSAPMRRAVVAETTAALDQLPAQQAAERDGTSRAVFAAGGALLVVIVLSALAPGAVSTAASRLFAPWNHVEWPRHHDLEFVDPPALLARGDALEVAVVDAGGKLPDEVAIEFRYQMDGRTRSERTWMQRVGSTMVARRENVERSLDYRAVGGDHRTMPWRHLEVIERPTASGLALVVHPPTYSGLSPAPGRPSSRVLSGSSIALAATASGPLASGALELEDGTAYALEIEGDEIRLPHGVWQPTTSSATQPLGGKLRLVSKAGLTGLVDLPPLELVADTPPAVQWSGSSDDPYMLATATVPMTVVATDNLALAAARLTGSVASPTADGAGPTISQILLEQVTEPPTRDEMPPPGVELDQRELKASIALAEYDLAPGDIVELSATASDFLPQTGVTSAPRRVHIITPAELDSRIAEHQAEILRLLEQALADQRTARQQAVRVAAEEPASRQTLDGLLSTRLTQQTVGRTLTESPSGVLDRTADLLDQLAMNGLDQPDLVATLEQIMAQVSQLRADSLPAAEAQLTELRKLAESLADPGSDAAREMTAGFDSLSSEQATILAVLQGLIDRASAWSDADRFTRELARLEQDERALRERSLDALRRDMQSRTDRNVAPIEQPELEQLAAEQRDLARRFDKLIEGMRQMARKPDVASDLAARLENALAAAEASQLSSQIASASRELQQQQLGRASETQQAAADALRDLVDRLRDRAPTDPGELASRLKQLQRQLAELAREASQTPPGDQGGRQQLSGKLQQMSRELARHTAQQASQSAQQASSSAAPKEGQPRDQQRKDAEQTQKDIEQAQRELAERIAELESEQQQRVLDRLAQALDDLIPAQQQTLESTIVLEVVRENSGDLKGESAARAESLGERQTELAGKLDRAMRDVEDKAVFQLALGGAAEDMRQAARGLARLDTGRVTQNLELNALTRMRHVLEILRQGPPEPPEGEPQQSDGGGDGAGGQPQRAPLIELAEVKMLRWLQVELNGRTRQFEADLADSPQQAADKRQAAGRLAEEQQQLEELVREMMRRNNRDNERSLRL